MQMSRSVIMPMGHPASSTTGIAPTSPSHISWAARASESASLQLMTFFVIKSLARMVRSPFAAVR
jgi:hypothetical protein